MENKLYYCVVHDAKVYIRQVNLMPYEVGGWGTVVLKYKRQTIALIQSAVTQRGNYQLLITLF